MSELISRTGRVQSWIDDPDGRLPVSCTVMNVSNEMEGPNGIEASWKFASHALRNGAGVAIHLSELDPRGFERAPQAPQERRPQVTPSEPQDVAMETWETQRCPPE